MIALIDGDIITYSVAHAAENYFYIVPGDDKVPVDYFKYKKDALEYCTRCQLDPASILKCSDPSPPQYALHSTKLMIESILDAVGANDYRIFLTGKNNFRTKLCPNYKAHRPEKKPEHYKAIREYMLTVWQAELVEGMEADDAMGLAQSKDTIICSLDKDMDTVPGWHYNWNKKFKYHVSPDEADRLFWKQMLEGDVADNITAIPGVGPKTASKILKGVSNYACAVGLQYAIHYDDPETKFNLNKELLWIRRR